MSQVVVVATFHVRPGQEQAAREALSGLARDTHAEAGCLAYALHEDPKDPLVLIMIERWTSSIALESHFQQPYVKAMLGRVDELLSEPPHIRPLTPLPSGDPTKGAL